MKEIFYITTSPFKFELAEKMIAESGTSIKLTQLAEETPEIQSTSVKEITTFSAREMYRRHQKSVVVSDAGCYISELNGFPGPFIKYINKWLTSEDLGRLFTGLEDRSMEFRDCLAFIDEAGEVHTFTSVVKGELSLTARGDEEIPIDTFFIPEGDTKTLAERTLQERKEFWFSIHTHWRELLNFIAEGE